MSKAFKCDRCERYEDGEPVAGVTFQMPTPVAAAAGSSARKTENSELCAQCLASLRDWRDQYTSDPKDAA